jgi:hypothetical protein
MYAMNQIPMKYELQLIPKPCEQLQPPQIIIIEEERRPTERRSYSRRKRSFRRRPVATPAVAPEDGDVVMSTPNRIIGPEFQPSPAAPFRDAVRRARDKTERKRKKKVYKEYKPLDAQLLEAERRSSYKPTISGRKEIWVKSSSKRYTEHPKHMRFEEEDDEI